MSVVDEVKDRLDIVEVIQSYVPLRKAGRNYKGLCPFHSEKTPSFVVFPHTGTWHCFGACGTGGDVFSFVMKQENLDFGEALKMMAQRAGVELEPRSPEAAAADQRQALLREINQTAATYFHHLLGNSDEATRARAYLDERGLSQDTIDRFQVGYALDSWDSMQRYLTNKGYALADIAETGLIIEREDKSGHYDRFRGRIIFPIRDHQGRTIGFGGRVLGSGVPKYLNSPQTPIFDKSSILFGLDHARQGIRAAGEAVIVEGYMDVLMAHQAGINNVVAQMGTALTEHQLGRLKRYTQRFVLALDSDAAGDQATLRGLDVARQVMDREVIPVPTPKGLIRFEDRLSADIRIVSLPVGLDPDEVIRESPARWAQLIGSAKPVMDYYFQVLTLDLDLAEAKGKAEAVRRLGPLVAELNDRVQRTHYLQQLSRMVQTDERALWQQIQQSTGQRRSQRPKPKPVETEEEALPASLDAHCLAYVLESPELLLQADEIMMASGEEPLGATDLQHPEDRAILGEWRQWLADGKLADARAGFYDSLAESLQSRMDLLYRMRQQEPPTPDDLVNDKVLNAITELRLRNLKRQNAELVYLHRDAQSSKDREALRRYGQINTELVIRRRRLEKFLNERSLSGRRQTKDAAVRVTYSET